DTSLVSAGAAEAAFLASLGIATFLFARGLCALGLGDLALELFQLGRIAESGLQQVVQLVVALQTAAQVRQLGAQIQQVVQRFDLLGYLGRLEILQAAEFQIDAQLSSVGIVTD